MKNAKSIMIEIFESNLDEHNNLSDNAAANVIISNKDYSLFAVNDGNNAKYIPRKVKSTNERFMAGLRVFISHQVKNGEFIFFS